MNVYYLYLKYWLSHYTDITVVVIFRYCDIITVLSPPRIIYDKENHLDSITKPESLFISEDISQVPL